MPCKACHKPKVAKIKFVQGRRYAIDGEEYLCAQVGWQLFALISLTTGNRWNDAGPFVGIADGKDDRFTEVK